MLTFKEFKEKSKPGTYAGVRPMMSTAQLIEQFSSKFYIPNHESISNLHVTLLYSKKHLPNYVPNPSLKHIAIPSKFVIWTDKTNKRILALLLSSPSLESRHVCLMKEHQAHYDYPEYIPHITLSYDIGRFDDSKLDFSMIAKPFELSDEYQEDLNELK